VSAVAPALEAFFTQRLMSHKHASPHTIAAYRDTCRLLLAFAQDRSGKAPSSLEFDDLDAPTIGAFLDHLERERGNSAQSRNARLAAIHSLFRFAALRHPEHAALIARVLAIPPKRFERTIVPFLERPETDALLAAPDRDRWIGRRDHALLTLALQTGMLVAELCGLACQDVQLESAAHVRCTGKGRICRIRHIRPYVAAGIMLRGAAGARALAGIGLVP
jgi:site-specific recombinase XerD